MAGAIPGRSLADMGRGCYKPGPFETKQGNWVGSTASGCTAPVEAGRANNQAALDCAEKYFDGEEKQGMPIPNAMMADFSITSRAKKTSTIVADPRCDCILRRTRNLMSTWQCRCNNNLARGLACGICPPESLLMHPNVCHLHTYEIVLISHRRV